MKIDDILTELAKNKGNIKIHYSLQTGWKSEAFFSNGLLYAHCDAISMEDLTYFLKLMLLDDFYFETNNISAEDKI